MNRSQHLSQFLVRRRSNNVSAPTEAIGQMKTDETAFDLEIIFCAQYERVARVIARVVRDPSRAEELAVEAFLKLERNPQAQGQNAEGWLYRVAVRLGLDELRRQTRRARYESLFGNKQASPTPEEIWTVSEERERVRLVLGVMDRRRAELLVLRSHGLSYCEVASVLDLKAASVGTLLIRAQQAFRKEYVKRYGEK